MLGATLPIAASLKIGGAAAYGRGGRGYWGKEVEGHRPSFPQGRVSKGGAAPLPLGWGCLRGRGSALPHHGESVERGACPSFISRASRSHRLARLTHRCKEERRQMPPLLHLIRLSLQRGETDPRSIACRYRRDRHPANAVRPARSDPMRGFVYASCDISLRGGREIQPFPTT